MLETALFETTIRSLPLLHRGKVRDIYAVDDDKLLIIQTDRLSAFDNILPTAIPGKGRILTELSQFWFDRLNHIIPNHLTGIEPESVVNSMERNQVKGRAFVTKRLKALPIEAVVRGYIVGSGWKEYEKTNRICNIELPKGLQIADKLPNIIFTPSTKAAVGERDLNICINQMQSIVGKDLTSKMEEASIRLYTEASEYALSKGIIIADTKFEFGLDNDDNLFLIDEVLTPDSSRFWPIDQYKPGQNPPSFDKQYIRDWIEKNWNQKDEASLLPNDVILKTMEKYGEVLKLFKEGETNVHF